MCTGAPGGGDDSAQREKERQKQQNEAINRLNVLFGIEPSAPSKSDYGYVDRPSGGILKNPRAINNVAYDPNAYRQGVDQWEQQKLEAEANKTEREAMYDQVGTDLSEYLTSDLDRQKTDADRIARFALARRGVRGGSSDLDTQADLLERYNRGILEVGNRADETEARLRSADEDARLALISRIQAGMSGDSAIQSAQQQLRNNTDSIRTGAMAQSLGSLFDKYADLTVQQNAEIGRRRAYGSPTDYRSYIPNSNKTYSGRVY